MKTKNVLSSTKQLLVTNMIYYRQLISKNRLNPTPESIHELRIRINKLLAALEIANSLSVRSISHHFSQDLERIKKKTSDLRDVHVEVDLVTNSVNESLSSFESHLLRRKLKLTEKTKRFLLAVPLKVQNQSVRLLLKKIESSLSNHPVGYAVKKLNSCVDRSFENFKASCFSRKYFKAKNLHLMRGKAKQLRYLVEAQMVVLGSTEVDIVKLKRVQDLLGEIQDNRALIANADKFLDKRCNRKDRGAKELKKLVYCKQKRLMKSAKSLFLKKTICLN